MPRPKNKEELLYLSKHNFEKLFDLIDSLSEEKKAIIFPKGMMNRNIRDVLAHLHEWHLMFLEWYAIGMNGKKPIMPKEGFTWKDTSALNLKIWQDCQHVELKEVEKNVKLSYFAIRQLIEKHSEEELFEKQKFVWTGSTSLGSYMISATSSHYDWALKLLKKALK